MFNRAIRVTFIPLNKANRVPDTDGLRRSGPWLSAAWRRAADIHSTVECVFT